MALKASTGKICTLSVKPHSFTLAFKTFNAPEYFSTKATCLAPRLRASKPIFPVPPKRSRKFVPSTR